MDNSLYKVYVANATSNIGLAVQYISNLGMTEDPKLLYTEINWILVELKCACSNLEACKNLLNEECANETKAG